MVFLICIGFGVFSQTGFSLSDTIMIQEVVKVGELRKYQPGAKIDEIPVAQINLTQDGGIENVLRRFTPVYIKSDAGGLSSIHFRGTSASHTTINFGGINLNSLTLGQSNLSNIPLFLFDGLSLQYGSSSTINGSGAIGGAIYLTLDDKWTDGIKATAKTTIGSFGEFMSGAKFIPETATGSRLHVCTGIRKKMIFLLQTITLEMLKTRVLSAIFSMALRLKTKVSCRN